MSWWITIEHPDPTPTIDLNLNVTYNVGAMLRRAGVHPSIMDGMDVTLAHEVVDNACWLIDANQEYFRKFEPDNKWGTVETTLTALRKLRKALNEAPEGMVVRWY